MKEHLKISKDFIEIFLDKKTRVTREYTEIVENSLDQNYLCHYKFENENFMNLMDILLTQPLNYETREILFELINANNFLNCNIVSSYSKFCKTILSKKISDNPVFDIISTSFVSFNMDSYLKNQEFDENLSLLFNEFQKELVREEYGQFNSNHSTHELFTKIQFLCENYIKSIDYLGKLFNYLKGFSKVLYVKENNSNIISQAKNTSFFELLNYNRSELMGIILFEKHIDPSEFELYFSKMDLDFLYHLVGNCFPTVNLHTERFLTDEELFPENSLYNPSPNILQYIINRNWLLALILKEMYNISDVHLQCNKTRIKTFLNYRKLKSIQILRCLFLDNEIITSLQHEIPIQKVTSFIQSKIPKNTYGSDGSIESDNNSLESAEEIIEDIKSIDWKGLFEILESISEIDMKRNKELKELKDFLICNIINDRFEHGYYRYIYEIENSKKRLEIFENCFLFWPVDHCLNFIEMEKSNFTEEPKYFDYIKTWEQTIKLCDNISNILNLNKWSGCQSVLENYSYEIFNKIINTQKIDQILLFIKKYKPSEEMLLNVKEESFLNALRNGYQLKYIQELLNNLPREYSISVCKKLLKHTTNIKHLNFFVEYLSRNSDKNLEEVKLGINIISKFSEYERGNFLSILNNPLYMIEVLLMNSKFDKLNIILTEFKHCFDAEEIDKILRKYAEKSLDFRIIDQPPQQILKTLEFKLIESLESSDSEKNIFKMPLTVPNKEEWVPNNTILECMCCSSVTFSMFSRRHHCRRCGRVICSSCSMKKLKVENYGDLLVRVCEDCYEQTMVHNVSISSSKSSVVNEMWIITDDEENNKIVWEEFSYEHAPSVSICLSILKHHSRNLDCLNFLFNQCNNLYKVLYPSQETMQEIDYLLVVKMLKSLAMTAKIISQECLYQQGILSSEKLLTQAELLGLFSERGCLHLLPISNDQTANIDSSVLRRLRDKLLEREQWSLALEVSTKSGLDTTGVFAAWGKSCLKAGSLTQAREKFQRCLEKRRRHESYNDNSEYYSINSSNSTINKFEMKNPPLLDEIIYILESKTAVVDKNLVDEVNVSGISESMTTLNQSLSISRKDPPISILNKLRNLDQIASGKYYFPTDKKLQNSYAMNRPIVDTVFYNECIFYLNTYGSQQSLLEFYLKHGELDQALQYILDNNTSYEIFIEIYMRCLKDGVVNVLQENIAKIDSTLELWKNYLRQICGHLEKQTLLHSLYQLQLFMGDYLRAAITCIKFYKENTENFSDLARKNNFLLKAEEHLKQIHEQEQWVEVSPVKKVNPDVLESYEEKSIANPSLVLKLEGKSILTYLNTIWRQNEIASFLADCEAAGVQTMETLKFILPEDNEQRSGQCVPTLFGSNIEKVRLAILILVASMEIETGFKITQKLISDFKLRPGTVYCQTSKHLAKMRKIESIIDLVDFIKKNSDDTKRTDEICDEMLTLAVATLSKENAPIVNVESLIKQISDKATKISAYIEAKQLKTAYFFAVRFKRISDIKRILREAELNNQHNIKALCLKVLQTNSQLPSSSTKD